MKYFSHKEFKHFLKKIKHMNVSVHMFFMEDNSVGFAPFIIDERIKIETIKHELWENQAMHHYEINDKYSFEIPADAIADHTNLRFSYYWTCGPTNRIRFSRIKKTREKK